MATPRPRLAPWMLALSTAVAVVAGAVTYVVLDGRGSGDVTRLDRPGPGAGQGVEADGGHDISGLTFQELGGTTTSLAELEGRPMVLNFFGSWCPPCLLEMPELEAVHQELGDAVTFLGLAVQDRPEDVRKVVADTGVTYLIGRDVDNRVALELIGGLNLMPATAFVDPDGTVVSVHLGELDAAGIRSRIAEHLGVGS